MTDETPVEQEVEKKDETPKTTGATEDNNVRVSPIAEANAVADRLEKANAEKERLLVAEQNNIIEKRLSGDTTAGSTPVQPKEETPKEYKDRVMSGKL